MIAGMSSGLLWSFVPGRLKHRLRDPHAVHEQTIKPASAALVDAYVAWCGVNDDRYAQSLPPHFFAHYGMPMVARLTSLAPCNMLSVVNQGVHFRLRSWLPRNAQLTLRGELVSCRRDGQRMRVHTRVTVGSAADAEAMTVDTLAAVVVGKSAGRSRPAAGEPHWQTVGEWSADRADGQRFFFLTGDFNPIHTLWPVARRTRFGGCILHGFGTLARTIETIQNGGPRLLEIDARFIKPNLLPSGPNRVQVGEAADADGFRPLQVLNHQGEAMLGGRYVDTVRGLA